MQGLVDKALNARRESKRIEFKGSFDGTTQDWCEILKDVFAFANSGGGVIVFGLDSQGGPTAADVSKMLRTDPATVTDKVYQYTGDNFSDFELFRVEKRAYELACLVISSSPYPIIPNRPGTYPFDDPNKKVQQKTAFSAGVIYVRRGAASRPALTRDMQAYIGKILQEQRQAILKHVQQAPDTAAQIVAASRESSVPVTDDNDSSAIRISENVDAPELRYADPNKTHPYRAKDVIMHLKMKLPPGVKVTYHDLRAVWRVYDLGRKYVLPLDHGPTKYSDAFIDFVIKKFEKESPYFFDRNRARYRRIKTGGVIDYSDLFKKTT